MNTFRVIAAIWITAVAMSAIAQDRPDLSGEWVSAEWNEQLTIDLSSGAFAITEKRGPLLHQFVYNLNGQNSHNETRTVTGELWLHDAQARWIENAVLVTAQTTRTEVSGSWEWVKIYHLTSRDRLSVTLVDKPLGTPGAMVMRTTAYVRSSEE